MLTLEDKHHHSKSLPFPSSSPALYAEHDSMWYGMSVGSWSQIFQLCPFPASCPIQAPLWWGGMRRRKCVDSVQELLSSNENFPVLLTIASTNPKHSPTLPTMKKLSSKTSTDRYKSKRLITQVNMICFGSHRFNIDKF